MVSAALVWTLVLGLPAATSSAAEGGSVTISGLSISELSESNGILNTSHLVVLSGTYTNQSDKTIEKLELNLVTTPALNSRSELDISWRERARDESFWGLWSWGKTELAK